MCAGDGRHRVLERVLNRDGIIIAHQTSSTMGCVRRTLG